MSPILGIYASQISGHLWAPSGAYDSIATATGTGSSGVITFTSIPSTYTHLQIRGFSRNSGGGGPEIGLMQFNSDTGSNYVRHRLVGDGSTASAGANTSQTSIAVGEAPAGTSTFGAVVIDILDYANTNKYKTIRALGGYDSNGSGEITLRSGLWMSTSAISSVTITLSAQNYTQYSQFALYGVKGS